MRQHYELLMIFPVSLQDQQRNEAQKKIFDLVTANGGVIQEPTVWGNQKLAYGIKHQTNGFYVLVEFDHDSEFIKRLDADMRLMPELLRYLIIKKKVKSEATLAKEKKIQEKIAEKKSEAVRQEEIAKAQAQQASEKAAVEKEQAQRQAKADAKKISLDNLDEKLDEILKEEI